LPESFLSHVAEVRKVKAFLRVAGCMGLIIFLPGLLFSWTSNATAVTRHLPEFYIPGRSMAVTIDGEGWLTTIEERIPGGWSVIGPNQQDVWFDQSTSILHWTYGGLIEPPTQFQYEVQPPLGARGKVQFNGTCNDGLVIEGDSCLGEGCGISRYRPSWATIQETIDSAEAGDTVIVSGRDSPFVENLKMKPGVKLSGLTEGPTWQPPVLQSDSALPGIAAAAYTEIRGFIIRSASCGILIEDPKILVSDCVITQTQTAAVECSGASDTVVLNCTIVGNEGCGVISLDDPSDVTISNCIFYNNCGKDVENCTPRFCLLRDPGGPNSCYKNIMYCNPMFRKPEAGDYSLSWRSPCIDAGETTGRSPEEGDILGNPRVLFGGKTETTDLGAYEYWFVTAKGPPVSSSLTLSWASQSGSSYSVLFSEDLTLWNIADDDVLGSGFVTIWEDASALSENTAIRFYRVMENK
jgi:hypothetical protein